MVTRLHREGARTAAAKAIGDGDIYSTGVGRVGFLLAAVKSCGQC